MQRVTKKFIIDNLTTDPRVLSSICSELKGNRRLYTTFESGSGKRTRYVVRTAVIDAIRVLLPNYDYKTGNDAPRGGRLGDYIELTTAQYNKMIKRMKWVYDAENALAWDDAHRDERIRRRVEREERRRIGGRKPQFNNDLEGISLANWIALSYEDRHPSPKSIYDLKVKSGMSWTEFENSLK